MRAGPANPDAHTTVRFEVRGPWDAIDVFASLSGRLYVRFSPDPVLATHALEHDLAADYDARGDLVGIEMLRADAGTREVAVPLRVEGSGEDPTSTRWTIAVV